MSRSFLVAFAAALSLASAGCSTIRSMLGEETVAVPAPSLERIGEGVWVHKSYENLAKVGPFLSQGLVVDTGEGVLLVDTAWNNDDTEILLTLIRNTVGEMPELAIVTHAHNDKMGGVGALIDAKIAVRAHPLTNQDAPGRGLRPAPMTILGSKDFDTLFGESDGASEVAGPVQIFYPGPGHTRDNIVVYYAPARVLFGGCLVRPANARDLGNTADADIANWADAVRAVAARFPDAEIIIPSHGAAGGRELLDHTIALAEAARGR